MSGGLLLAWMERQYESKHLVHMDLLDNRGNPLSITFVYGQPEVSKREERWLCIGDFNQILSVKEKFSFGDDPNPSAENFQLLVSDLRLCDLVAQGQQFTWMNKNFVMERLDKAFASVEWVETYPNYALTNHPIIKSDHGPITLDFDLKLPFQRRPFRFECMWLTHPSCKEVVQRAWKKRLLQDLQNNVISMEDVGKEKELREELECLLKRELMWAQKARSEWILKGDRNTRYFQAMVKQRRSRSRIHCINNSEEVPFEDLEGIERIFMDHFKSTYESANTYNENENTVFQLGPYKASGPNGIPAFFFQGFWQTVKHDICNTEAFSKEESQQFKEYKHSIELLEASNLREFGMVKEIQILGIVMS
ncbi:hypothetical protein ACB092_09G141900 [Castanea dentata]